MIRPLEPEDTDTVLEIWLRSSVAAHDFVPRSYWEGKLDEMRTRYLLQWAAAQYPTLELSVYAENKRAVRFYLREGFEIRQEQTDANTGRKELHLLLRNKRY